MSSLFIHFLYVCPGERRIRVHTLSLPVVSILQDVLGGADQETVIGLVAKMGKNFQQHSVC